MVSNSVNRQHLHYLSLMYLLCNDSLNSSSQPLQVMKQYSATMSHKNHSSQSQHVCAECQSHTYSVLQNHGKRCTCNCINIGRLSLFVYIAWQYSTRKMSIASCPAAHCYVHIQYLEGWLQRANLHSATYPLLYFETWPHVEGR